MTYSNKCLIHPSLSGAPHISCPSSSCFSFLRLFLCSSLSGLFLSFFLSSLPCLAFSSSSWLRRPPSPLPPPNPSPPPGGGPNNLKGSRRSAGPSTAAPVSGVIGFYVYLRHGHPRAHLRPVLVLFYPACHPLRPFYFIPPRPTRPYALVPASPCIARMYI